MLVFEVDVGALGVRVQQNSSRRNLNVLRRVAAVKGVDVGRSEVDHTRRHGLVVLLQTVSSIVRLAKLVVVAVDIVCGFGASIGYAAGDAHAPVVIDAFRLFRFVEATRGRAVRCVVVFGGGVRVIRAHVLLSFLKDGSLEGRLWVKRHSCEVRQK